MDAPTDGFGRDRFTSCLFGVAFIAVGLAICLLGAGSLSWIIEQGVRIGPVVVLLVFAAVGVGFITDALRRK